MWLWWSLACSDGAQPGTDPVDTDTSAETEPPVETDNDADGDGFAPPEDCDDADVSVFPGATDVWYDGIDSDCAGNSDFDQDGDGDNQPAGGGLDCDDTDAAIASTLIVNSDMGPLGVPVPNPSLLDTPFPKSPLTVVSDEPSTDNQHHTTVSWGEDGNFVAAWQHGSGSTYVTLVGLFDDSGARMPDFPIKISDNDTNGGKPDVEAFPGGYIVAYEGGGDLIFLRPLGLDAIPTGPTQLVFSDSDAGVVSSTPDLALFDDGSGVIVWESDGGSHGEGVHYVQRFSANLDFVGEPIFVKAAGRTAADVAALPGTPGGFVVTGTYKDSVTDIMQVYAVKFGADGCQQEIRIDQGESDAPSRPAIAIDALGRMAVTWRSKVEMGLGEGSYGRFFEASGLARTDAFALARAEEDGNRSVVAFWGNRVVFAWQGIVEGTLEDVAVSVWDIDARNQVFAEDIFNDRGTDPEVDAHRPSISIKPDPGSNDATLVVTWEEELNPPTSVFNRIVTLVAP